MLLDNQTIISMNISASVGTNVLPSKQLESCYILRPIGYYFVFLWIFGVVTRK